jgi:hypothetical protein
MRNLEDYQKQYRDQPYERYQVYFRKKKVVQILSQHKHDTLLEIGCGLNPIFNDVSTFSKLYIVEPGGFFFEKACDDLKKLKERQHDIMLIQKMIEDCSEEFKNVKFDFVLLSALLHEIKDPEAFLAKIHQMISEHTVLHVNVPNARSFHRLLALEMGLIETVSQKSESNNQFQQHAVFDTESLAALVRRCGFRILEQGTFLVKPFTHQQMENMIAAGMITERMLEGFYGMDKYLPELGSELFVNLIKA